MTCPVPKPLSITLPAGTIATRYGVVSSSTPEECLPYSLVNKHITAVAANMAQTYKVWFVAEVVDDAAGQFKITFDLQAQPMQVGTYQLQVAVKDVADVVEKVLTGTLNITQEPL